MKAIQTEGTPATSTNGKVKTGIPYGSMIPPASLVSAFAEQGKLEARLLMSREDVKKATAVFFASFKSKFPKAGLADFARQFDKNVPTARAEYKSNTTYLALDNMFRYMPEVKTGGKAETEGQREARIAKMKKDRAKKTAARQAQQTKALRLICAIASQIGIPTNILTIAAQRVGFTVDDVEQIMSIKGGLIDVGMGTFQLVTRAAGIPATKAVAAQTVKTQRDIAAIPTAAELASQAKSKPTVKDVPVAPTEKVYLGKGQFKRVAAATLSTPTA